MIKPSQNELNLALIASGAVISALKQGRNLLAFSHGVDSTALFYILSDFGVNFDLAIVDYNVRAQSKAEVAAARELAAKFGKRIFVRSVELGGVNFECRAREARYEFFAEICAKHGYGNLVLAHQLDDKFEWFLMQLGRGAGLNELLGMDEIARRGEINLIRPLLGVRKCELEGFLQRRGVRYFIDESNLSDKFSRNQIRREFAEPFLSKFGAGVARSFEFLRRDKEALEPEITHLADKIYLVKNDLNAIRGVDRAAKILGVVMSAAQKNECEKRLREGKDCVVSGRAAIGIWNIKNGAIKNLATSLNLAQTKPDKDHKNSEKSAQDIPQEGLNLSQSDALNRSLNLEPIFELSGEFLLVTPYVNSKNAMDKKFKEACRILKIPPINREYIYKNITLMNVFGVK